MSTVALTRAKPEKKPSRSGRYRRYKFDKYRDRADEASAELGFPPTMEAARRQFRKRISQWARFYYNTYPDTRLDFKQLFHFGEIGVMEGYARFDPSMGVQFNTFCDPWIRTTIRINLDAEVNPIVKSSTKEYYKALKKGLDAYENGEDPSKLQKHSREIYQKLESGKISVEDFRHKLRDIRKIIEKACELDFLDEPLFSEDDAATKKDAVVSPYLNVDDTTDYESIFDIVRSHAYSLIDSDELFKRESSRAKARVVFEQRCFRDDDEKKVTLDEIAEWFNVSRQCISQIQDRLEKRLIPRLLSDPVINEAKSAYLGS